MKKEYINNYKPRRLAAYRMTVRYNPLELILEFRDYPDVVLKGQDAEKWIEEMRRDHPDFDWNLM